MRTVLANATVIDCVNPRPVAGASVTIDRGRIVNRPPSALRVHRDRCYRDLYRTSPVPLHTALPPSPASSTTQIRASPTSTGVNQSRVKSPVRGTASDT